MQIKLLKNLFEKLDGELERQGIDKFELNEIQQKIVFELLSVNQNIEAIRKILAR